MGEFYLQYLCKEKFKTSAHNSISEGAAGREMGIMENKLLALCKNLAEVVQEFLLRQGTTYQIYYI